KTLGGVRTLRPRILFTAGQGFLKQRLGLIEGSRRRIEFAQIILSLCNIRVPLMQELLPYTQRSQQQRFGVSVVVEVFVKLGLSIKRVGDLCSFVAIDSAIDLKRTLVR